MKYSYQDMIAQKLLVGLPDKKYLPELLGLIKKYHIGGVILYKNNYDSINEMVLLVNKLKEANLGYDIPLFIAIDQEGGRVNRLPNDIVRLKSSYRQCLSGEVCVKEASSLTSKLLHDVGINMDFAPVLDIRRQKDDNAFIGNRAFSSSAFEVTNCGRTWCQELLKNSVIPVIKHFPGHGSLNTDSHIFLPIIRKFKEDKSDLIPFKELIKDGVPAMMVGHILIKGKTGLRPATLSKSFINDYIRNEYNFKGLIVTDELGMRAVRIFYGKTNSVRLAFEAGNDIICIKYHPRYVDNILKALVNDDSVSKKDIVDSFNRIIDYKQKYHLTDIVNNTNINIKEINDRINKINEMDEQEK